MAIKGRLSIVAWFGIFGVLFSSALVSTRAHAYPTLARHGYTSCSTCHYNPSGGGILTSYGKYIAQELFGTFNDSASAAPWLVKPEESPTWVASILARGAQSSFDTEQVKRSAFRKMQFDLEGGWVNAEGYQILGAVGPKLDAAIEGESDPETLHLRRFWAGKVTLEYAVRVGRFFPEFGINHPHHNIPTRKGLYFNHGEEPLTAQGSYFTETYDATLAVLKGSDDTAIEGKKGYAATVAYKIPNNRFGFSRMEVKGDGVSSGAQGVFAQIGYLSNGYTLIEIDEKNVENQLGRKTRTRLGYLESGWEVYKGVNPYVALEYTKAYQTELLIQSPQLGLQFHPVTHTELVLQVGRSWIEIKGEKQKASNALAMVNVYF